MELKAKRQCLTVYNGRSDANLFTLTIGEDGLGVAGLNKLEFECTAAVTTYRSGELTFYLNKTMNGASWPRTTNGDIVKASCHWSFKVRGVIRKQSLVLFDSSGQDGGVLTGLENGGDGRREVCSIVLGQGDRNLERFPSATNADGYEEQTLTLEAELEVLMKLERTQPNNNNHLVMTKQEPTFCATGVGLFSRKRGDAPDVTIKCSSGEFKAHKNVLTCCSPVFARMLTSPMDESLTKVIKIEDFAAETIQDMITFMYGGTLQASSTHSIVALLDCAEKYDIPELKAFVVKLMLSKITADNATEFAAAAVKFRCDEESNKEILRCCKVNFEKLNVQPNFRQFFKDNVDLFLNC